MGLVDPFYFKTGTVWHKAIAANGDMKTVTALCGHVGSFDRRNRNYEDTETRPYAGKVCTRCDTDAPVRVIKRSVDAGTQTPSTFLSDNKLSIRKGKPFPRPDETDDEVLIDESDTGPGLSYDDAVRRKARRILP